MSELVWHQPAAERLVELAPLIIKPKGRDYVGSCKPRLLGVTFEKQGRYLEAALA